MSRRQVAAALIGSSGVLLAVSSLLPWVGSDLGSGSGRPAGAGVALLISLGLGLLFIASRVLRQKAGAGTRVVLWLLSVLQVIVVIAFYLLERANTLLGGVVHTEVGLDLAGVGLLLSLAGTVVYQLVPSTNPEGPTHGDTAIAKEVAD